MKVGLKHASLPSNPRNPQFFDLPLIELVLVDHDPTFLVERSLGAACELTPTGVRERDRDRNRAGEVLFGQVRNPFRSIGCRGGQQLRALSSRFSASGCPEPEGTRLSGERVIPRADSFHSASTSTSRRTHPLISLGVRSCQSSVVSCRWRTTGERCALRRSWFILPGISQPRRRP